MPDILLDAASSCQDIHNWLATLDLPGWYIHPKLVSYTDLNRKRNELKKINQMALPEDHKVALYKDFQLPDTLSTLTPKIRNTGTLVLMSGPLYSASDLNSKPSAFHTFVFVYKDNTAIIIDPGYGQLEVEEEGPSSLQKMRFSSMGGGLGLGISLLRKMKGKNAIGRYWLGKGTDLKYDDTNCNTLAQDFVKTFVKEGGNMDWEKIGFEEIIN